jgi:hypothetical protein
MPPEFCPNCGAEVPRKAKACPECGADEETGLRFRVQRGSRNWFWWLVACSRPALGPRFAKRTVEFGAALLWRAWEAQFPEPHDCPAGRRCGARVGQGRRRARRRHFPQSGRTDAPPNLRPRLRSTRECKERGGGVRFREQHQRNQPLRLLTPPRSLHSFGVLGQPVTHKTATRGGGSVHLLRPPHVSTYQVCVHFPTATSLPR